MVYVEYNEGEENCDMPLRDHFRAPLDRILSWEELHGQWPAVIVQQLRKQLPPGYAVGPRVHSGSQLEIDVAAFEKDEHRWAAPEPTVTVETEVPDYDEYEVRIYDAERGRQLVAAIELVSPGNKDRPEKRNAFVGKCATLLQKGIAVSIVDLVTPRQFNLYAELLQFWARPTRLWANRCHICMPCRVGGDPRTSGCCCKPGRTR